MNKRCLALTLGLALAGMAQAQTAAPLHGGFDSGLIKQSGATLTIGKRDANTLGVKSADAPGLKATFELDIRVEPDSSPLASASPTLPNFLAKRDAVNPFAISGTYKTGALGAMLAYERDGIESTLWSVSAVVRPMSALKLMASYADQDLGPAMLANASTTAWLVGANYMVGGAGTLLFGYGREVPEGVATTRLWSIGYEYPLSKRIYLYADASDKKAIATVRHLGIGIRAAF